MGGQQQPLWFKNHVDPITSARTEAPMVRDTIRWQKPRWIQRTTTAPEHRCDALYSTTSLVHKLLRLHFFSADRTRARARARAGIKVRFVRPPGGHKM